MFYDWYFLYFRLMVGKDCYVEKDKKVFMVCIFYVVERRKLEHIRLTPSIVVLFFHRERYALALTVYFSYSHYNVLVKFHHFVRVFHVAVGKL